MCVFLATVASARHLLVGFACAVSYTHVYLACISTHCAACSSYSLFLDIQVVALLLGQFTLICMCKFLLPHCNVKITFVKCRLVVIIFCKLIQ